MNIAALISGGVDSAVVVHLLCEQGYKPDLFYIKIGMDGDEDLTCTAEEDIELCTATARKYMMPMTPMVKLYSLLHQSVSGWGNVMPTTPGRVAISRKIEEVRTMGMHPRNPSLMAWR